MTTNKYFTTRQQESNNSMHISKESFASDKIVLYEELRLIERNENEINVMWKGAHMLMFFLAFVFGSFCTCCFHTLMRMFGNKCVLFPKFVSYPSMRLIIYEYFSIKMAKVEDEPVQMPDYISTQWSDSSVCYVPTYVPLMSGLGGLVWATMFLMCSGSSTTGGQRHWRSLPFMFVFSLAMSVLCIYSSVVTHSGLQELCTKLVEITGLSESIYTINVATLAYERRIRGLYQATRLTIASAWLHTACWVLSALLVAARVLLAVDFTLVTIKAQLIGDVDAMLQKYEDQINSISPKISFRIDEDDSEVELYVTTNIEKNRKSRIQFQDTHEDTKGSISRSEFSLVPEERQRLRYDFIHKLVDNLVDNVFQDMDTPEPTEEIIDAEKVVEITNKVMQQLSGKLTQGLNEFVHIIKSNIRNKLVKPGADGRHIHLHISDESINKVALKNENETEENEIEKSKEKYKTSAKSMDTLSHSERTLTSSSIKLSDSQITDKIKNTDKNVKEDEHVEHATDKAESENRDIDKYQKEDEENKRGESQETVKIDENIRDTDSVHTITPFDNELAEENKETEPNQKKLKKGDRQ